VKLRGKETFCFVGRAIVLANLGRDAEALADVNRDLVHNDWQPQVYHIRAIIEKRLGKHKAAKADELKMKQWPARYSSPAPLPEWLLHQGADR
jgi:hypothetical protein